jgi:thiamine biosynthesis lipoprotein
MRKVFFIYISLVLIIACSPKNTKTGYIDYKGFAAGTFFSIEYDKNAGNLNGEIDLIIRAVGASVDISNPNSAVNLFNRSDSTITVDEHFLKLFGTSANLYMETNGAFDPTAVVLNRFWNSDKSKYLNQSKVDSSFIDSIKTYVGLDKVGLVGNRLDKKYQATMLDFDNVYRGYMVDLIAAVFASYQVNNYRIEIGGRIRAKGLNTHGKPWDIGLDEPTDEVKKRKLMAITTLNDEAMVTAGTYRNYFLQGEKKMPFTIDPHTGYPVKHTLISVSVFSSSCAEADAYAAAFMVMGPELTKQFLASHGQIQAYLISTNYKGEWESYLSQGLKERVQMVKEDALP